MRPAAEFAREGSRGRQPDARPPSAPLSGWKLLQAAAAKALGQGDVAHAAHLLVEAIELAPAEPRLYEQLVAGGAAGRRDRYRGAGGARAAPPRPNQLPVRPPAGDGPPRPRRRSGCSGRARAGVGGRARARRDPCRAAGAAGPRSPSWQRGPSRCCKARGGPRRASWAWPSTTDCRCSTPSGPMRRGPCSTRWSLPTPKPTRHAWRWPGHARSWATCPGLARMPSARKTPTTARCASKRCASVGSCKPELYVVTKGYAHAGGRRRSRVSRGARAAARQGWPKPEDRLVFVGDLVAKGPDSQGVVQLARERTALAVLGNHDAHVLGALQGKRFAGFT